MFFRSAVLLAVVLAATVAAGPQNVPLKAPALQSILAPGSPMRAKLVTMLQSATGLSTDEYQPPAADFPPPSPTDVNGPGMGTTAVGGAASAAKPDDAAKCAAGTGTPVITRIKGELTSGGYMVIEGKCFGPKAGSVLLSGFNTTPQVSIQVWTPTAITVQFPKIVGVPDLIMQVTVSHGLTGSLIGQLDAQVEGLSSKPVSAKFTAAFGDSIPLPSKYIAMNACGGVMQICLAAAPATALGMHIDSAQGSGADIWTFTIPEHWHLSAVRLVHLSKSAASSSTINGGPTLKTVRVAWTESAVQEHADATSSCSPAGLNSMGGLERQFMQQICAENPVVGVVYTANYRIEPMVRGPAGMTLR